jgi:hypothetical protein
VLGTDNVFAEEFSMSTPPPRHWWSRFSVARLYEAAAILLVLLIGTATAHQLLKLRSVIIADTERQMARLDMVFAEQTGRAVESVDLILRNAIENLEALRAKPPVDSAVYQELLARRTAGVRQLSEVAITDTDGHVLYSSRPGTPHQLPPVAAALVVALALIRIPDWNSASRSAVLTGNGQR